MRHISNRLRSRLSASDNRVEYRPQTLAELVYLAVMLFDLSPQIDGYVLSFSRSPGELLESILRTGIDAATSWWRCHAGNHE